MPSSWTRQERSGFALHRRRWGCISCLLTGYASPALDDCLAGSANLYQEMVGAGEEQDQGWDGEGGIDPQMELRGPADIAAEGGRVERVVRGQQVSWLTVDNIALCVNGGAFIVADDIARRKAGGHDIEI